MTDRGSQTAPSDMQSNKTSVAQHPASVAQGINCLNCHYSLYRLDASGKCPECGVSIQDMLQHITATDAVWLRHRQQDAEALAWSCIVLALTGPMVFAGLGKACFCPMALALLAIAFLPTQLSRQPFRHPMLRSTRPGRVLRLLPLLALAIPLLTATFARTPHGWLAFYVGALLLSWIPPAWIAEVTACAHRIDSSIDKTTLSAHACLLRRACLAMYVLGPIAAIVDAVVPVWSPYRDTVITGSIVVYFLILALLLFGLAALLLRLSRRLRGILRYAEPALGHACVGQGRAPNRRWRDAKSRMATSRSPSEKSGHNTPDT